MFGYDTSVLGQNSYVVGYGTSVVGKALEWSACGRLCFGVIDQGKGVVGYDVQVLQLEKKKEKNKMGSSQRYT